MQEDRPRSLCNRHHRARLLTPACRRNFPVSSLREVPLGIAKGLNVSAFAAGLPVLAGGVRR